MMSWCLDWDYTLKDGKHTINITDRKRGWLPVKKKQLNCRYIIQWPLLLLVRPAQLHVLYKNCPGSRVALRIQQLFTEEREKTINEQKTNQLSTQQVSTLLCVTKDSHERSFYQNHFLSCLSPLKTCIFFLSSYLSYNQCYTSAAVRHLVSSSFYYAMAWLFAFWPYFVFLFPQMYFICFPVLQSSPFQSILKEHFT